ncbi:methylenetetrahydrofolate reductase [Kerstersia similis]|uniref:methylenetetrahydrofolate reductase n=1 Tax=Kerstersia similis TaxID=206505 RepID=UPI0039F02891
MTQPSCSSAAPAVSANTLLQEYSLEMTAKEIRSLAALRTLAAPGTPINITFLPNEQDSARLQAAIQAHSQGLLPVPHLAARRIPSETALRSYLSRLREQADIQRVFVIAGDPPQPAGPYADALALIQTGLLAEYGIRQVNISGYPDGHPGIPDAQLWAALHDKHRALSQQGHDYEIITQFGFEAAPVLAWLERLRQEGITAPVRIGVAGPVGVHKLLRYAAACGVGASAGILRKYGVSLSRLFDTAGPELLLRALAAGLEPERHGIVRLHFFPFGDMEKTLRWILAQPA